MNKIYRYIVFLLLLMQGFWFMGHASIASENIKVGMTHSWCSQPNNIRDFFLIQILSLISLVFSIKIFRSTTKPFYGLIIFTLTTATFLIFFVRFN
jgi:hypothetical protein